MNITDVLRKYREYEEKNIIITDAGGKLLYESRNMEKTSDIVLGMIAKVQSDFEEQEFFDKERDIYLNIRKAVIRDGEETYCCYSFTDVRDYALLIRDVSLYNRSISDMSKFQTCIMNRLFMSYDTFLPGLADYCSAEEVMMFMKSGGKVTKSTYIKELTRTDFCSSDEYARYYSLKRGDISPDGFSCILNSSVMEHECVVLVRNTDTSGVTDPMDISIHNVIRLFIENSILREHIVYESEHDKLTGLYNKGKYMKLKNELFGRPRSIAIYNFDVNNLKHINDNYGHEYGDALIIKAAKSIASVTSDKIFGFRMGGDEYVMVAADVTQEKAEEVRERWKAALDRLNEEDKSLFCSMACGMVFASGDYNYDELYEKADRSMYENKKLLKENGITSHIAQ